MVVLAASICSRGGKALLSRQFRELSKDKITSLLANFPSLISNSSSQHTTVEDEAIRYVYQPLEEFYIVLLTNKYSNILQDIDTLHLFASTISNMLRSIDEREIFDKAFDILGAFDEIINLGYKENLTMSQVQTFLEMDSHEEKIQEIIERNKELEATEERKRRAKEIQRKELARKNLEQQFSNKPFNRFDDSSNFGNNNIVPTYQPPSIVENAFDNNDQSYNSSNKPMMGRSGGLQLGKKPTKPIHESNQPLLANNQPVFQHATGPTTSGSVSRQASSPAPSIPKVPNNGILITINEKITGQLSREGSVELSEVKGDLQLRINDADLANCKLLLKTGDKSSGIQYKTHPNVDRNLFNDQSIIGLKDKSKSFPSNDQSLGVLRWRAAGKSEDSSLLPIVITAWVNVNDNGITDVTLEYELSSTYIENNLTNTTFENLKILIPIASPDVNLKEEDDTISYEVSDFGTVFTISSISTDDPQGSFEFTIPADDEDSLFPMELQFDINYTNITESDNCFGKIQVVDVVTKNQDDEGEESLPFELHENIMSESYQIN